MKNILTIDLEEWFHANYHPDVFDHDRAYEPRVVGSTHRLLELFAAHGAKATFFVLGYVAEKYPELIRDIHESGHEIATHGYGHELVYRQSPAEFRADVVRALKIIEEAVPVKVLGYRAPSWSLTENSLWAWEVLEDLGFAYDASVFPVKTYLYGLPSSPRFSYHPEYSGKELRLLELPSSTVKLFNRNIPFAGGFYLRALPYLAIKAGIRQVNKENAPAIVYLHPREIDPGQPRLKLSMTERLIHYYGIRSTEKKLIHLLQDFEFTSITDFYGLREI